MDGWQWRIGWRGAANGDHANLSGLARRFAADALVPGLIASHGGFRAVAKFLAQSRSGCLDRREENGGRRLYQRDHRRMGTVIRARAYRDQRARLRDESRQQDL